MAVRRASHAGSWYTDDATTLNAELEGWLREEVPSGVGNDDEADQATLGNDDEEANRSPRDVSSFGQVRALICPHAG
jgi:predicted class III extradiol MEMO1 family dioxygenase